MHFLLGSCFFTMSITRHNCPSIRPKNRLCTSLKRSWYKKYMPYRRKKREINRNFHNTLNTLELCKLETCTWNSLQHPLFQTSHILCLASLTLNYLFHTKKCNLDLIIGENSLIKVAFKRCLKYNDEKNYMLNVNNSYTQVHFLIA